VSWAKLFIASNEPGAPPPTVWKRVLNFSIAFLLVALIFYFSFHQVSYQWNWHSIYKYRQKFLQGWINTILISLASLGLSTCIGLVFALGQRSRFLPFRYFSTLYIQVVRGTPLLVQILIFFYVVANAFGVSNRYLVGVLTLSFFSGAYISEVIRAGIESIGKSQLESAKAIGLTRAQTYRYVILPQALRQTLPPLAGQFVSLIKDSSLLSIISISEFTLNAQEVNSYTFSTLESYIPLAIGYLILTLPISIWTRRLEEKHRYET
jgi:polar amino acid transport system permease protein